MTQDHQLKLTRPAKEAAAERKKARIKAREGPDATHPATSFYLAVKPIAPVSETASKFRTKREGNEATSKTGNWKTGTYKPGDGDYVYHARAGSCHKHIKSHGDRT
jgi:hypothetical protein